MNKEDSGNKQPYGRGETRQPVQPETECEGYCEVEKHLQLEEALKLSEARYQSLIDNATEGISVFQDGIIKFANKTSIEITGYTLDELNAMPAEKLIHPDDRERVMEYHRKRLRR